MTSKERLMRTLRGQKVDRLPFAPLINNYFLSSLPEDYLERDEIGFLRSVGADIAVRWVSSYHGLGFGLEYDDVDEKVAIKYQEEDANSLFVRYSTPYGVIWQKKIRFCASGDTWQIEKPLVKTAMDLASYHYLWENVFFTPCYEETQYKLNQLGEDGIALLHVPATPILQLIMYDMGIETFYYLLEDEADKMTEILNTMHIKCLEAIRIAAKAPGDVLIVPENSGTMLVSKKIFAIYCAPLLREYVQIAHEHNKLILLHACGHMKDLLLQVKETGMDGIESLTPPPTGNVTMKEAVNILGQDMVIMGGIDPVIFAQQTPNEVADALRLTLNEAKGHSRFVLMPADSTAAGTPPDNFRSVLQVLRERANQ